VKRWTHKVDIFSYELVLIPVHLGLHWCLAAVDFDRRKVSYYDSLGSSNSTCLDLICLYLEEEHADKKGLRYNTCGFAKVCCFFKILFVAI
jgi:sentrin-specific protease 1